MKANELRIGNYFNDKEGNELYCCGVASEKWEDNIKGVIWFDLEGGFFLEEDEISGIPLTEEWLLKFGFYKGNNHTFIKPNIKIIGDDKHSFGLYIDNGNDRWIVLRVIQHLHQLQNLYFALTSEELTLKQ